MQESFVNVFKVLLVMYRFSSAFLWCSAFCNICNVKWFWYHFCRYVSIFQSLLFDFMLFKPLILLSQLYTLFNFFSHESGLSKILKYEAISSTLSGEYLKCTLWWGYGHKLELKENVLICATGENTILQTIYSNFCKF